LADKKPPAKSESDSQGGDEGTTARSYPIERLVGESRALLGQPPHVVAGALSSETRKTLTREQARRKVDAFLSRKVKTSVQEG
jgi:hypothetical protein